MMVVTFSRKMYKDCFNWGYVGLAKSHPPCAGPANVSSSHFGAALLCKPPFTAKWYELAIITSPFDLRWAGAFGITGR